MGKLRRAARFEKVFSAARNKERQNKGGEEMAVFFLSRTDNSAGVNMAL